MVIDQSLKNLSTNPPDLIYYDMILLLAPPFQIILIIIIIISGRVARRVGSKALRLKPFDGRSLLPVLEGDQGQR